MTAICLIYPDRLCRYTSGISWCTWREIQHSKWDSSWWRHQMKTFSTLPSLWAGNSPVTCEFSSHTTASDAELWYFLSSTPEQTVEYTIETPSHYDVTVMYHIISLFCFHNIDNSATVQLGNMMKIRITNRFLLINITIVWLPLTSCFFIIMIWKVPNLYTVPGLDHVYNHRCGTHCLSEI